MKDTMKIERGEWTLDGNAIWQFTPEEDITGQLAVSMVLMTVIFGAFWQYWD